MRPSGPTVTSENWVSWSSTLIGIGSVQLDKSAVQRTAKISARVKPSGAVSSMVKSE